MLELSDDPGGNRKEAPGAAAGSRPGNRLIGGGGNEGSRRRCSFTLAGWPTLERALAFSSRRARRLKLVRVCTGTRPSPVTLTTPAGALVMFELDGGLDSRPLSEERAGQGCRRRRRRAENRGVQHRALRREQGRRRRVAGAGEDGRRNRHGRAPRAALGDLFRLLPRSGRAPLGDHPPRALTTARTFPSPLALRPRHP